MKKHRLDGQNILVFGMGLSGVAATRLLLKVGASVVFFDTKEVEDERINSEFQGVCQVRYGSLTEQDLHAIDIVVISPGIPLDLPIVEEWKQRGLPIWGEIELAYVCGSGDVLAITGTNGKTTTTALLGEIMKVYQENSFVVGNIGIPYTEIALQTNEDSIIVAEVSSFQLESIHSFHPKVSAILNITEDHLDRHHTMEAYIEAKKAITNNQTTDDFCILNYDNDITRELGKQMAAQVIYFSRHERLDKGLYIVDGQIVSRIHKREVICDLDQLRLLGEHNHENAMAAIAMALCYGVPTNVIREALYTFKGVAHRLEYVTEFHGVVYYNDSKGTNPDAAIKGIKAMNRPTILIGGGYDKDSHYDEWIEAFDGKVKHLVLLGATKNKIKECAIKQGFEHITLVDDLQEAVTVSRQYARPGDAVLLSPACASWGMYKDFEERGDHFKKIISNLS